MIRLLLTFSIALVSQSQVSRAGQTALRVRPREHLQARSLDISVFAPTNRETFHTVGDDPNYLYTSYHEHAQRKFVNFEKFEEYLRPQDALCSSQDNETAVLNFPLDPHTFDAAERAWKGIKDLVFIGHDPSCFAPREERSTFKVLSMDFANDSHSIQVTGQSLRFGQEHFPAPTKLTIGRAPSNQIFVSRMERRDNHDGSEHDEHCGVAEWIKQTKDCLKHLIFDFNLTMDHIVFTRGQDWAMDTPLFPSKESPISDTGIPHMFEIFCHNCTTSGGMDQDYILEFQPFNGSETSQNKTNEAIHSLVERKQDFSGEEWLKSKKTEVAEAFREHIKRNVVRYTITDEVKIRKQIRIKTSGGADVSCSFPIPDLAIGKGGCSPFVTAGGLAFEPGGALEDKKARAQAEGKSKIGKDGEKEPNKGNAVNKFGWSLWPMDIGIFIWMTFGIATEIDWTTVGFELTIPKGSTMEIQVMGDGERKILKSFDPTIEMIPPDSIDLKNEEIHFNIAVGPKMGLNIGLPKVKHFPQLGLGAGVRLDLIRFDNRLQIYENVTKSCATPQNNGTAFEKAVGFTIDLKTGVYAYFQLAGFFIDTSWIGSKAHGDFSGLYWGIKNLVAKCLECHTDCIERARDLLNLEGTLTNETTGMEQIDGKQVAHLNNLGNSSHVKADSVNDLDMTLVGDDFPTGDISRVCRPKVDPDSTPSLLRRWLPKSNLFGRALMEDHDEYGDGHIDVDDEDLCKINPAES